VQLRDKSVRPRGRAEATPYVFRASRARPSAAARSAGKQNSGSLVDCDHFFDENLEIAGREILLIDHEIRPAGMSG
jgi:hypothetical protein